MQTILSWTNCDTEVWGVVGWSAEYKSNKVRNDRVPWQGIQFLKIMIFF